MKNITTGGRPDDYEATTGHAITCAAGFGMGCQCADSEAQQDGTALAAENEALWGELHRRDTETDQPHPVAREWCKCRSCWGWFVEDHPGEDLDELGKDLDWWSGLPEHRDAPADTAVDRD